MTEEEFDDLVKQVLGREFHYALASLIFYSEETKNELPGPGFTNLRDSLCHIRRAFVEEDVDKRAEQLYCAREHVRRAAVETYQELFEQRYVRVQALYSEYRKHCMPSEALLGYEGKVQHVEIVERLHQLRDTLKTCRKAKDGSEWDENLKEFRNGCRVVRELGGQVYSAFMQYCERGGDAWALPPLVLGSD